MKNKNKGLIVLIIILIILVVGLSGYIVYDKFIDNKNNDKVVENKTEKNNNEKGNKMPEKSSNYTFVKSNIKEITVNGKNHKLISYYYYDKEKYNNDNISEDIYYVRKEVYLDSNKVYKMHKIAFIDDTFSSEDRRDYNKLINEDIENTKVEYVKDSASNEQYILFTDIEEEEVSYIDNEIKYKVLIDKKGNELYKFALNSYNTGYYMDDNNIKKDTENYLDHSFKNSILYVGNDYLYYLDINNCTKSITGTSENAFAVDEYQLKIKNGKLEKIKTTTYDNFQVEIAGAGPSCK